MFNMSKYQTPTPLNTEMHTDVLENEFHHQIIDLPQTNDNDSDIEYEDDSEISSLNRRKLNILNQASNKIHDDAHHSEHNQRMSTISIESDESDYNAMNGRKVRSVQSMVASLKAVTPILKPISSAFEEYGGNGQDDDDYDEYEYDQEQSRRPIIKMMMMMKRVWNGMRHRQMRMMRMSQLLRFG